MYMFYNYTPISVDELVKNGFKIEEHEYYSSLQYGDDYAIVLVETDEENKKFVTDIARERGKNNLNVIKELYKHFNLRIVDGASEEFEEIIHWTKTKKDLDDFIDNVAENVKMQICK